MILKDEMQKRLNKETVFNEEECKIILDEVQKYFLELQKDDNREKQFKRIICCAYTNVYLMTLAKNDYNIILEKNFSYNEAKEGIREIKEILKGQFTEIKEIEGRYALELIIDLS